MIERLAKFMYERQVRSYGASQAQMDRMWALAEDVRGFWIDEASAVLAYLRLDPSVILVEVNAKTRTIVDIRDPHDP